ncbi:MAG: hypothetical protein E6G35_10610 [Actinobacteria bacterium]|nr:MAG: hypothetical protein E6G35_10610 [Actinomycetota bacterium]
MPVNLSVWVSVATVAAGLASVGSLLAVAWQLKSLARQTKEQAKQAEAAAEGIRASVYLTVTQTMIGIDQFLIDRPRLRAKLYGELPTDDVELSGQQAEGGAEMLVDMFDMVVSNVHHISDPLEDGWRNYMVAVMQESATMREFWKRSREWYSPELRQILDGSPVEVEDGTRT